MLLAGTFLCPQPCSASGLPHPFCSTNPSTTHQYSPDISPLRHFLRVRVPSLVYNLLKRLCGQFCYRLLLSSTFVAVFSMCACATTSPGARSQLVALCLHSSFTFIFSSFLLIPSHWSSIHHPRGNPSHLSPPAQTQPASNPNFDPHVQKAPQPHRRLSLFQLRALLQLPSNIAAFSKVDQVRC